MEELKKNNSNTEKSDVEETKKVVDETSSVTDDQRQSSTAQADTSKADRLNAATVEKPAPALNQKMVIAAVLLVAAIAAGAYWFMKNNNSANLSEGAGMERTEVVSLTDLPEVVVTVNNTDIARDTLVENIQFLENSAANQGITVSDPQVMLNIQQQALDQVINNELLIQAAAKADVSVADEAFNAEFEQIKNQFPSEEEFSAELERSGLTVDQLKVNIRTQMTLMKYIDGTPNMADLPEVTDEEAQTYYDQLAAQGSGLPVFEDLREQIKAQIGAQNEQAVIAGLLTDLRKEADIKVLF